MKCRGHITSGPNAGDPCPNDANRGGLVCNAHGGLAPQVKRKAMVRAEIMSWDLPDDALLDPGQTLLRLVAQSEARVQKYSAEIERITVDAEIRGENLADVLVSDQMVMSPASGQLVKVGDYIVGMVQLEQQERVLLAKFSKLAVDAGLMERAQRMAEREQAQTAEVLALVLERLGVSAEDIARVPVVLREVLALPAGA